MTIQNLEVKVIDHDPFDTRGTCTFCKTSAIDRVSLSFFDSADEITCTFISTQRICPTCFQIFISYLEKYRTENIPLFYMIVNNFYNHHNKGDRRCFFLFPKSKLLQGVRMYETSDWGVSAIFISRPVIIEPGRVREYEKRLPISDVDWNLYVEYITHQLSSVITGGSPRLSVVGSASFVRGSLWVRIYVYTDMDQTPHFISKSTDDGELTIDFSYSISHDDLEILWDSANIFQTLLDDSSDIKFLRLTVSASLWSLRDVDLMPGTSVPTRPRFKKERS